MNYLKPEDYETAEKNGLSKKTVNDRFYHKNWSRERAITQPLGRKSSLYSAYKGIAVISSKTFKERVEKGWSPEKAATTPRRNGNQYSRKGE